MKMISNTSITSTSGVTLMSAIGMPVAELELKAIVLLLRPFFGGDEADLGDALLLGEVHHVADDPVFGGLVAAHVDLGLRHFLRLDRQLALELVTGDRRVVPVQ